MEKRLKCGKTKNQIGAGYNASGSQHCKRFLPVTLFASKSRRIGDGGCAIIGFIPVCANTSLRLIAVERIRKSSHIAARRLAFVRRLAGSTLRLHAQRSGDEIPRRALRRRTGPSPATASPFPALAAQLIPPERLWRSEIRKMKILLCYTPRIFPLY